MMTRMEETTLGMGTASATCYDSKRGKRCAKRKAAVAAIKGLVALVEAMESRRRITCEMQSDGDFRCRMMLFNGF